MTELISAAPPFVKKIVEFPEKTSYELLETLADYRICHDGTPLEARIVFNCKQVKQSSGTEEENAFIIKVKVQVPGPSNAPPGEGPSTTTTAEVDALERFKNAKNPYTPQLIAFKKERQDENGPLPGGYITYTIMTKLSGKTLYQHAFWGLPEQEHEEIRKQFLLGLRFIYDLGIEPIDRGLRNVLWDRETKKCAIIDFELWRETTSPFPDEELELYRWGLASMPPMLDWATAWRISQR